MAIGCPAIDLPQTCKAHKPGRRRDAKPAAWCGAVPGPSRWATSPLALSKHCCTPPFKSLHACCTRAMPKLDECDTPSLYSIGWKARCKQLQPKLPHLGRGGTALLLHLCS